MAMPGGAQETLDNIPTHVWKGLPDSMKLKPSRVNEKRIGVWASKLIPKGKRFGPFIGERKKRSQVTSNVYMWEVYFPTRGWMCVDATDPMKGNWLRYVNWARSSQEQNLFPLEINRSIYYKVLRPIGPNEELLVLYNGEDNPEIAAALEEERASSSGKKSSPRSRRAKKKLLEKVGQAAVGFCGSRHNQTYCESVGTKPTATKMRDSEEGLNESNENLQPSSDQVKESVLSVEPPIMVNKDSSFLNVLSEGMKQDGEEDCDEEEPELKLSHESSQSNTEAKPEDKNELQIQHLFQSSDAVDSSANHLCETEGNSSEYKFELEADPTFDDDPQAETHHCQHCERHFSTKQGLERHIHIHTITNHEPHTFKCRYCAKPFGSQVGRRRHERRHESGLKKKPGSLAGTAVIINSSVFNDSQSSVSVNPASHIILGTQNGAFPQSSDGLKKDPSSFGTDENGESKELHVCKYCKKAFGTHTNMRRHQRRIHERHLMPKGVRRKGILLQEVRSQLEQQQDQCLTPQEARGSPPPVYVPSVDTEDEGEREEYMVDISKNISENLNLYLDGKILSTNSGSNCEVIEVDSRSAALFGLDAVIISPDQIKQAIKFDTRSSLMKDVTGADQAGPKRRTSTPPLMPTAKMEPETISSAASLSSTSSQSPLLVGNILPQSAETLAFQKEKPIYLSPKLKQLLQNQDSQKSTIALIADRHRLTTPCTVTSLPAATGRFKRRTTSPPTSLQSSSSVMTENSLKETEVSFTLKVPRVESHSMSSAWSLSNKDQKDPSGSPGEGIFQVWPDSRSGGSSCNQQPLDLSNSDGKRNGNSMKESGESVLDLSLHRKSMVDPETRGSLSIHPHTKKKKPNTSMLEKVLMNEYAGLSPTGEESSPPDGCLGSHSPSSTVGNSPHSMCHKTEKGSGASVHPPSPPPLTPVTLNTSSPSSSPGSSTPPPPVLPTVVSPPPLSSQNAQSSDSLALCSSPELPPKMSPCPLEHSEEEILVSHNHDDNIESCPAAIIPIKREMDQTAAHLDTYNHAPLSSPLDVKGESIADSLSNPETLLEDSTDLKTNLSDNVHDLSSRKDNSDCSPLLGHVSSESETSSAIFSSTASNLDNQCLQMPEQRKEEPTQRAVSSECVSPSISLVAPDEITDEAEMSEPDTFAKNFVCNVCEDPFRSIKELSHHITNHVAEWPYKCEFCVQLFRNTSALLEHRSALHGVGRIYVCSICSKEFAFLCNLQQHQKDLHPGQAYTHSVVENGKLRPQNYTDSAQANGDNNLSNIASGSAMKDTPQSVTGDLGENDDNKDDVQDDKEPEDPTEELYTTIKIMASEAGKPKGPDVRLGLNQHYPSFKPPPFPYHNRTPAGSVASATNFTTHNIPQTFSTAIRCTKCGNSFDNMPELHKHILACANASDKRRYTPKKNPIPLRQIAKPQNGALVPKAPASNGQHVFHRVGHPKRLNFSQELPSRMKMTSLNKKKNQLVQKAISQKNKTSASAKKVSGQADEEQEVHVCPHCNREFTYPASLTKHIACSCPMKPLPKTSKKVAPVSQDKNMKLRSRSTNAEIKQEPDLGLNFKTLGKTRSRSLEPAESDSSISSKAKPMVSQMRMKRGASNLDNTIPQGKKSKKGSGQHPSETPHHAALDDASQRSAMKLQSKEVGPKKVIEGKSQQSHNQPKKEERFSLRTRERIGGPVTRSLQMASATASVEVKTEDFTSHEQRESQETLSKLAR